MSVPRHSTFSRAGGSPDRLAVFRGRRFLILPGESGEPGAGRPPLLSGGPEEVVFELGSPGAGATIIARQRGAAEAGTEIRYLKEWARRQGCELAIGCPLPAPARSPGPLP